jgi:hypothetical protein
MSWTRASKGTHTATNGIASTSIEIAVEVKEIAAWAKGIDAWSKKIDAGSKEIDAGSKEIDAGAKEIDADLEELQTALQVHRLDLTSLPPAAPRSWHAGISIVSGPYPRAPSTERVTPDRDERNAPCSCGVA